jgi:hypothetical protein
MLCLQNVARLQNALQWTASLLREAAIMHNCSMLDSIEADQ